MARYVIFHGESIVHPGVYTWVDYSQLENILAGLRGIVAVLGDADEGEPGVVATFSRSRDMISYYKKGPLADIANALFSPSTDPAVGKPFRVIAVRTNAGSVASATFQSGATDVLRIISRRYGLYGNTIQAQISDGSVAGSKKVSLKSYDVSETSPDITGAVFTIQRSGATATMTIDDTKLETIVDGNTELSLDFNTYPTAQALVNAINQHPNYTATLLTGATVKSTDLDHITNVDISTGYTVRALAKAIVDWVNNSSTLCTAELITPVAPDNATKTLSGGSVGVTTASSFTNALETIKGLNVDIVIPLFDTDVSGGITYDQMVNAIANHINEVNAVKSSGERLAIIPKSGTATIQDIKSLAIRLNSPYIALVTQRVKGTDAELNVSTMPSWYLAGIIAGIKAGTPVGEPLTFKRLNIIDLVDEYSSQTIEDLILSGVMVVERIPGGGFRIAKDTTTYLSTDNDILCSFSAMETVLYIRKGLRNNLQPMIGSKGLPKNVQAIRSRVLGFFTQISTGPDAILMSTVDAQGNLQPPYRNVEVTLEGNVVRVRAEITIVPGIDFILNEIIPTKARL